jgi:type VI protein secretion system component Hcp
VGSACNKGQRSATSWVVNPKTCCRGKSLESAAIYGYEIDKSGRQTEYFRHETKAVKVVDIRSAKASVATDPII